MRILRSVTTYCCRLNTQVIASEAHDLKKTRYNERKTALREEIMLGRERMDLFKAACRSPMSEKCQSASGPKQAFAGPGPEVPQRVESSRLELVESERSASGEHSQEAVDRTLTHEAVADPGLGDDQARR